MGAASITGGECPTNNKCRRVFASRRRQGDWGARDNPLTGPNISEPVFPGGRVSGGRLPRRRSSRAGGQLIARRDGLGDVPPQARQLAGLNLVDDFSEVGEPAFDESNHPVFVDDKGLVLNSVE